MNLIKQIAIFIIALNFGVIYSQNDKKLSFGITAGFNYNANGTYTVKNSSNEIIDEFDAAKKTGYHGGIYIQYKSNSMYVRPEVVYSKTKSTYNSQDFDQTKIEIPILVGFDIVKPVSIFVGPSFQYTLENEFEDVDAKNIDVQSDFAVNFQAGIAFELFKQIRIDLRYEKGISDNILSIKNDGDIILGTLNTKPEQIVLNIALKF